MSRRIFCDRCGKEIDDPTDKKNIHIIGVDETSRSELCLTCSEYIEHETKHISDHNEELEDLRIMYSHYRNLRKWFSKMKIKILGGYYTIDMSVPGSDEDIAMNIIKEHERLENENERLKKENASCKRVGIVFGTLLGCALAILVTLMKG